MTVDYNREQTCQSPYEISEQKIKEIDESIRDLDAFIQSKMNDSEVNEVDSKEEYSHSGINAAQSENHFSAK